MSSRLSLSSTAAQPEIWIAYVLTNFTGGKETKVFRSIDDAKAWCQKCRREIIGTYDLDAHWIVSPKGFHYLAGCSVGAAQIEPHSITKDSRQDLSYFPRSNTADKK